MVIVHTSHKSVSFFQNRNAAKVRSLNFDKVGHGTGNLRASQFLIPMILFHWWSVFTNDLEIIVTRLLGAFVELH